MDQGLVPSILIGLTIILVGAKLGGELCTRLGLPSVLGELVVGVLLGNFDAFAGTGIFVSLHAGPQHEFLGIIAQIGAVVLLFAVGLETSVAQMLQVGGSSFLVALVGVITPWVLGFAVGTVLLPEMSFQAHLFLGAVLTATSVGISARVFRDLGRTESLESRIVVGAAVVDDVMGLLILAIVTGIVVHGAINLAEAARIIVVACLFLTGAVLLGARIAPWIVAFLARARVRGMKLISALAICFALAWGAAAIGLAPIVGAFAAGLVLKEALFSGFEHERPLRDLLEPFSSFFVPVFFVLMGIDVDLRAMADVKVLGLAAALTLAAIAGKQACGLAVLERGVDRISVGVGMVPRGEVGLIFAGIGRSLGVVSDALYGACITMVIASTFVAPLALPYTMRRFDRRRAKAARAPVSPDDAADPG